MDEILAIVKEYEGEQKELKNECFKLTWFMRGGVSVDEVFTLSYEVRSIISEIIKENLDTTKKTGQPFF